MNRRPFPKPAKYDAARYALLVRLIEARTKEEKRSPALGTLMKIDRLPNGKTDVNNNGAFSTDFLGASWDYPDATYQKRAEIWQAHKEYIAGLLYFLANDPQVPPALREEMNRWGLAKDEFADNDNWPYQLYIRESRRMVGEYVMVQKDLQTELTKPDPIGMGSYNSDSHNVERIVDADGFVRNEGDMQVQVRPYQIPYRVLLPKRAGSPQSAGDRGLLRQPCGLLLRAHGAAIHDPRPGRGSGCQSGHRNHQAVQEIDTALLTSILKKQGAVMEYSPNPQTPVLQTVRNSKR